MPPETPAEHGDLRSDGDAHRCCAKWLIGSALVGLSQPGLQHGGRVAAEGRATLFPPLALAPHVCASAQDHVLAPEADQFRDAQTRLDRDGQEGPVATANPRRQIRSGENGRDLYAVEKR